MALAASELRVGLVHKIAPLRNVRIPRNGLRYLGGPMDSPVVYARYAHHRLRAYTRSREREPAPSKRHPDTEIGHFGHSSSDILHHDPQMTEFLPHPAGFSGTAPAVCVHADRFTGNSHRLCPWDRCLREHRRAVARNRPPIPQTPGFSGWRNRHSR